MRINYFPSKGELTMRFILGVLWGYYIRGRKRLLIITLTVFTVLVLVFAVVLPAIALSILGLDVMRERASRPPQTSVPSQSTYPSCAPIGYQNVMGPNGK